MSTIIDRFFEEADRLDALGAKSDADKLDKAVKMAMSGQTARAYLSLARLGVKNEIVASLMGDLWNSATGGDIKALQSAAVAASRLKSVAMAPTHMMNQRVVDAFGVLEREFKKLPSVFSSQVGPLLESIRGDVGGTLTAEKSQKITNAAGKIIEALSPKRLIEYQKGLPATPEPNKTEDNREKAILDAISNLRETNIPEERIPELLTKLKITNSTAEARAFLSKSPAKAVPTHQPEKITPAPVEKNPEKIISPAAPQKSAEPAPIATPTNMPQYPILKGINGALGLFEQALDMYSITLVAMVTMDPEKMVELRDELRNRFKRFAADRLSNTQGTRPATILSVGKEAESLMNEFLSQEPLLKDVPKKALSNFSKEIGNSVRVEAPIGRKEGTEQSL